MSTRTQDALQVAPLELEQARRVWQQQVDRVQDPGLGVNREDRMDYDRSVEQFERERAAIDRWAGRAVSPDSGSVLLLHRHEWVLRQVQGELEAAGVRVLGAVQDSDDAIGALVVGQPAVMLLSDRVPGCLGAELVQRARELSPRTACVVHVDADDRMQEAIAGGARAVLSHRQTAGEIVSRLQHLAAG